MSTDGTRMKKRFLIDGSTSFDPSCKCLYDKRDGDWDLRFTIYDLGFKVFLICVIGEICGYPFM